MAERLSVRTQQLSNSTSSCFEYFVCACKKHAYIQTYMIYIYIYIYTPKNIPEFMKRESLIFWRTPHPSGFPCFGFFGSSGWHDYLGTFRDQTQCRLHRRGRPLHSVGPLRRVTRLQRTKISHLGNRKISSNLTFQGIC